MDNKYKGLKENLNRFKNDLKDEKTRLLFSIAYKQGYDQALSLGAVSNSIATEYAEFCVRCDRKGLPLICLEDYIKQYCC